MAAEQRKLLGTFQFQSLPTLSHPTTEYNGEHTGEHNDESNDPR